jgi:hypothetical protein
MAPVKETVGTIQVIKFFVIQKSRGRTRKKLQGASNLLSSQPQDQHNQDIGDIGQLATFASTLLLRRLQRREQFQDR